MKILFVLDYYAPHVGGAETLFRNVIERLAARGHLISVLTCRHSESVAAYEKMGEGIEVYRVGAGRVSLLWHALGKTGRDLAREADVIHSTTYAAAIPASLLGKLCGKRVVLTVHEVFGELWYRFMGWKGFFHKFFERAIFLFPFDKFVCVSNYTKNSLRLLFGMPDDKLLTVYNGIDTDFWNVSSVDAGRVAELRKELGIENSYSALYFGRPGVSKGLEYFVRAMPLVAKEVPNFRAVLIVSGDEEGRAEAIRKEIGRLGMEDRVVWIPGVKYATLREYVAACDTVVVPSLVEGFGFSAAETCALGKNLVYSNAAALPEVVFGNVVPAEPANPEDIAKAVVRMNRGEFDRVSEKTFSWEGNVDILEHVYGQLTEK